MQETLYLKYPLPDFLKGTCTESTYSSWLINKAKTLFERDKKRNQPYVRGISAVQYCRMIHEAVIQTGHYDPYTGDELRWDLIGTWDSDSAHAGLVKYQQKYALMPVVDHTNPESTTLAFEICSWQVNDCKSYLNPAEFVALCSKVAEYCKGKSSTSTKTPKTMKGEKW